MINCVAIFTSLLPVLCRYFSSVRAVLQGACHMVAMQISAEPLVRHALRQVFQSRAVLSVKPTKKGRKVRKCYVARLVDDLVLCPDNTVVML